MKAKRIAALLLLAAMLLTLCACGSKKPLADGEYSVNVTLSGGSGRASVASPALLHVESGKITAEIIWSSSNYDYMVVGEKKYLPTSMEPGSTFWIPVSALDTEISVKADTVAMSTPHEIDYTLVFSSASLEKTK